MPALLITCLLALPLQGGGLHVIPPDLLTVAEKSGYTETARHAEVVALMDALAARSPHLTRASMGETFEGREIPLLVMADPPVRTAQQARDSGKTVVFAFGNIHAGEVCGKEALCMLARDVALSPDGAVPRRWLDELVIVLAPIYNADGNERVSLGSRPNQEGPAGGQGQRANAQDLDLNRDHMKLESHEGRAMAKLLTEWAPELVIDTHTTNGSWHRYLLTYAPPLNPSGHPAPTAFVKERMLPDVSRRLFDATGWATFEYGNFNAEHTTWSTYDARPRFGSQYHGLRNQMSILTEAYAYAPYRDRVLVTRAFVRECFTYAAENAEEIRDIVAVAQAAVAEAGRRAGKPTEVSGNLDPVGIMHRLAAAPEPATVLGWIEARDEDGRVVRTDVAKDYEVTHLDRFEPMVEVPRPYAYLIPPGYEDVVEILRRHGIQVRKRPPEDDVLVEIYTIDRFAWNPREYQGHQLAELIVSKRTDREDLLPGTWEVPVGQPLGTLAVFLLEPECDDGLAAWNVFDVVLEEGADFPVMRVPRAP